MRRAFVLAWRLHRVELVAVVLAAGVIAVIWLRTAADLALVHEQCRPIAPEVAPCGGLPEMGMYYTEASQTAVAMFGSMAAALPFVAGVVLGVPMAARELEHRTLHLAWPLARSRLRWLVLRLAPVAGLGVLVLLPAAMAGEVLTRSFYPPTDPGANFEQYGIRGPLIVLRFLPAVLLGALVGLLVGRQLPALLLAGALAAGLGAGLSVLRPFGAEPVEQPAFGEPGRSVGSLYVDVVYRGTDGRVLPEEEAWALMAGSEGEDFDESQLPTETFLVIPPSRYPEVIARESMLIGGATVALGAVLVGALRRSRGR
jgi:hypothetical protein